MLKIYNSNGLFYFIGYYIYVFTGLSSSIYVVGLQNVETELLSTLLSGFLNLRRAVKYLLLLGFRKPERRNRKLLSLIDLHFINGTLILFYKVNIKTMSYDTCLSVFLSVSANNTYYQLLAT